MKIGAALLIASASGLAGCGAKEHDQLRYSPEESPNAWLMVQMIEGPVNRIVSDEWGEIPSSQAIVGRGNLPFMQAVGECIYFGVYEGTPHITNFAFPGEKSSVWHTTKEDERLSDRAVIGCIQNKARGTFAVYQSEGIDENWVPITAKEFNGY